MNVAYRREGFTPADPGPDICVAAMVERWARLTPDRCALVFGDLRLTYAQLDARANRLAWRLIEEGVRPDDLVGVCLDRGAEQIIALLAVLKAGGAYLPLSPAWPAERLAYVAAAAAPPCAISTSALRARLPGDLTVLDLGDPELAASLAACSDRAPGRADRLAPLSPDNLAYALFTSGSTGRPKGVGVTQADVLRLFEATSKVFDLEGHDGRPHVWLQFHNFGFDVSVWEIFGALMHGGTLVALSEAARAAPDEVLALIAAENVSVLCQTPSAFNLLLEAWRAAPRPLPDLRYITFIGEALELRRLRPWVDHHRRLGPGQSGPVLINKYGPTETTVFNTWGVVSPAAVEAGGPNSIGRDLPGSPIHILDAALSPVPAGEVGEIYIAGGQLARGYLARPGLTAERFIACPFGAPGERMYRTGDLGRRLENGEIEYLGRVDQQVKLRGYRIELGEIEAVLAEMDEIAQAAVVVREAAGEPTLAAFLVPRPGQALPDAGAIRASLARRLPEYMIPAFYAPLAALPLNSSGKLDRKALPDIGSGAAVIQTRGAAPDGERETQLCAIFGRVLGRPPVFADDSFFDLGGHSLRGLRLLMEIERTFGLRLPLRALLENPTPRALGAALDDPSLCADGPKSLVPLAAGGPGEAVFMVHWLERALARGLGEGRPVLGLSHGLAVRGQETLDLPPNVESLAATYVAEMRLAQPRGPYRLIGHSSGGLVAFEMARQLVASGDTVAFLGLIDTQTPAGNANRPRLSPREQLANLAHTPPRLLWRSLVRATYRAMSAYPVTRRLLLMTERTDGSGLDVITERMMQGYQPRPYEGRVHIYQCRDPGPLLRRAAPPPAAEGWRDLALGGLVVRELEGDHVATVREPFATSTAAIIDADLAALSPTPSQGMRPAASTVARASAA